MIVTKTYITYMGEIEPVRKGLLDTYDPPSVVSSNYRNFIAELDLKTCIWCVNMHGQIYSKDELPMVMPPIHDNCRCQIIPMEAVIAGNATKDGQNGADWWIAHMAVLPDYYISDEDIRKLGWRYGKSPAKFAPGKMITMGKYGNSNGHLPDAPGRIWYEADINYYSGKRNRHRLLWSNDGLMFVTYDHYNTFMEIIF